MGVDSLETVRALAVIGVVVLGAIAIIVALYGGD